MRQADPLDSTISDRCINDAYSFVNERETTGVNKDSLEISCLLFIDNNIIANMYNMIMENSAESELELLL